MDRDREESFGGRLRRLREAGGFSREELASRARLSANAIGAIERGERRRPYPHTVAALADALGLSGEERETFFAAVPGQGVAEGGAPGATPITPDGASSSLPLPPTPLVGREGELAAVKELLSEEARLVTLAGAGGVGKTRLALEVVREVEGSFEDGAAFVPLAPLGDPGLVVPEIARTLGVREAPGRPARDALFACLRDKRLLLLVDNFEHVIEAATEVTALLSACPGLRVLVTSRAALGVRGERRFPVPPLPVPHLSRVPAPEEVAAYEAARLFVERARDVAPGFEITHQNAAAVAAICRRLDGIPLAIELAAALVRVLPPREILARLDEVLPLLVGGARDLPERQRTMRAALEWSANLLGEAERLLLGRLSVFSGGFTLWAAEAVGLREDTGSEEVVHLLGRLVDHSLVFSADPGEQGEARYGMLEPIRQYASELLEESEEAEVTQRRHAETFLSLAERAAPRLRGFDQVEWLDKLERDNDNIRAALSWALSEDEGEIAARMGWALWVFWWLRGHHEEGRRFMEAALEQEIPPLFRPMALIPAAAMAYTQADYAACERYCQEAEIFVRRTGDAVREVYVWTGYSIVAMARVDLAAATSHLEKSLTLAQRAGEAGMVPIVRIWLGTVLLARGERDRALALFEEGLREARARGDRLGTYNALYNLSTVALSRGEYDLAAGMLKEGVALSEEMGDHANLAYFLEGLAVVDAFAGEAGRATLLFGASEGLLEEVGAPIYNYYAPDVSLRESATSAARSVLGEEGFSAAWAKGRSMRPDQAVAEALGQGNSG